MLDTGCWAAHKLNKANQHPASGINNWHFAPNPSQSSMPAITIHRVTTDDPLYEDERELRNQVLLRPIGMPDHAWEMHDKKAWHFVAMLDDRVVGCVVLLPLDDKMQHAQLMQMAVDGRLQGHGVGRRLVDALEAFAKGEGIVQVTCHARDNAIGFYERIGYEVYDEPFVEVGIMHRHMKKLL